MPTPDELKRAPTAASLARLADVVAPGSRVTNVRRLPGGLVAGMHRLDLVLPDGTRRPLVLRRFSDDGLQYQPQQAARTWRALTLVEQGGVPAPRPVYLDADGELFGTPALLMTREPGRGLVDPAHLSDWLGQLAGALAALHRVRLDGLDVSFLEDPDTWLTLCFRQSPERRAAVDTHPLGAALRAALEHWLPRLRRVVPSLVHQDYWAGNTLWRRGRLTAIVDWDEAGVGYAGTDVGYCRMDLAMLIGGDAPDTFLRAYEAAAGRRIPQLHIWDLLGARRALPDPVKWLPGYHDLGRTDLTPALIRTRLDSFIKDALTRAGVG